MLDFLACLEEMESRENLVYQGCLETEVTLDPRVYLECLEGRLLFWNCKKIMTAQVVCLMNLFWSIFETHRHSSMSF